MADTRQPTAEEAIELYQKGIDPNTVTMNDAAQEDDKTQTTNKVSIPGAIGRIALAHAGGYAGAGGMMALGPFNKLGIAAGALVPGLGETGISEVGGGMIGSAIDAMVGGYVGQKTQEGLEGDKEAAELQQNAQEAEEQYPYVSAGTDIVGSALAGGGKFNLSNLRKGALQAFGKNALSTADEAALKDIGEEALSPTGVNKLLAQTEGKEALGKIVGSAIINPAINTGLDLATGHKPTLGGIASQIAGGALFSEQSALGRLMHGGSKPIDVDSIITHEPNDDTTQSDTAQPTSMWNEQDSTGDFKIDDGTVKQAYNEQLNPKPDTSDMTEQDKYSALAEWRKNRVKSADVMRQELHDAEGKVDTTVNTTKPTADYEATPSNLTDTTARDAKIDQDIEGAKNLKLHAENEERGIGYKPIFNNAVQNSDIGEEAPNTQKVTDNSSGVTANQQAELTAKKETLASAVKSWEQERMINGPASNHPDVIAAQQKAQDADRSLRQYQETLQSHIEKNQQVTAENPAPVGTVKPIAPNTLKVLNPKFLLPQDISRTAGADELVSKAKSIAAKQADVKRYGEVQQTMKDLGAKGQFDSPEFLNAWKENEQIKNRYGGMPPTLDPKLTLDDHLANLKVKDTGELHGGILGIATATWNGSIDAVRLGIKAGKAIHEAIKDGIAYIKSNHPTLKFDEAAYTKKVTEHLASVKTEVSRMGILGKGTRPAYDRIAEIAHPFAQKVADAFKSVSIGVEQRTGATWNKIKSVMDKVGYTKRDGEVLDRISEWENLHRKAAPLSMFRNQAQRAVYLAERQVHAESGQHNIDINEPVYRNGVPTTLQQKPYTHPTPLAPKIAEMYKKATDVDAIAKADKEFTSNAMKYGKTAKEAETMLNEFKQSLQGNTRYQNPNMTFFSGSRMAHGVPLPKSFTVDNYANRLETYYKRRALDNSFYKNVESNPEVMSALGEKKDAWDRPIPNTAGHSLAGNEAVQHALKSFQGEQQNPTTRNEGAFTNLASTLFASSPAIDWVHKFGSNMINGPLAFAENPAQAVKTAVHMISSIGDGIQHATENGVIKLTARSVSNFLDTNSTIAERVQALSQGIRNISSLGGRTDKWNMGLMQAGFESCMPGKVNKANSGDSSAQQLIKKLDPTYTIGKQYDPKAISELASQAAAYVHGTNDGRTMPPWMLSDSELSGFFKLAHWSIAQTNRFMSDVWTPATKGNITPLVNSLFGSVAAGYIIRELRESVQGKHGNIPDLQEIAASKGGLSGNKALLAYNALSAMQYAGFAGILSQAVKFPVDKMYRNEPQGAVFPLDEIASDIIDHIGKISEAASNDSQFDWGKAGIEFWNHVWKSDVQLTRIGFNQAVNNGMIEGKQADKKILSDKLGELRRFEMTSGLPFDSQEPSQNNPYMNMEQKEFKRQQDLPTALKMLPGLVQGIVSKYSDHPSVMLSKLKALKENQYETFPSLQDKPEILKEYMDYLTKLGGKQSANDQYADYMRHKIINEVKASVVP